MLKTGLIGDQFSSEWCHFSTTIMLFNQVIHHDNKVKSRSFLVSLNLTPFNLLNYDYYTISFKGIVTFYALVSNKFLVL